MTVEIKKGRIKEILSITSDTEAESSVEIRFTCGRATYATVLTGKNFEMFIEHYDDKAEYHKIEFVPKWDGVTHVFGIAQLLEVTPVMPEYDSTEEFAPVDWWTIDEVYRVPSVYNNLHINSAGGIIIAGLTGNGKTYNGLQMLDVIQDYYQDFIILNYELNKQDYASRIKKMNLKYLSDPTSYMNKGHVYTSEEHNIDKLIELLDNYFIANIVIVIDNIDNLVGGKGDSEYSEQAAFIRKLDRWCKSTNSLWIGLSQLTKDTTYEILFDAKGNWRPLTTGIVSGSKQICDLARTVLVTAKNPKTNQYDMKVIKMGDAIWHKP